MKHKTTLFTSIGSFIKAYLFLELRTACAGTGRACNPITLWRGPHCGPRDPFSNLNKKRCIFLFSLFFPIISNATSDSAAPIQKEPETASEYQTHALEQFNQKNYSRAIHYYQKALALDPNNGDILRAIADSYQTTNNPSTAIIYYTKALALQPENNDIKNKLGICYLLTQNADMAIKQLAQIIEHNPEQTDAYVHLGRAYALQNNQEQALKLYRTALNKQPNNFDAHHYAGIALKKLNRIHESLTEFRAAEQINSKHPYNLLQIGNTLTLLHDTDEAIKTYLKILSINPNAYTALYNIGYALKKQGNYTKAIDIFNQVITLKPDYALAHLSLATTQLALGDYASGWYAYEWRWKTTTLTRKTYTKPVWNGSNPKGKTILIYAEQALGDTLQFVRYCQLIKQQGGTVIFESQKPLALLLSRCPYIDQVISLGDTVPDFDYHIPLMSLPLIFNTRLETIPATIPFLYADPRLIQEWKTKIAHDKNFKIGICWHGYGHYADQAQHLNALARSIPLQLFEPLSHLKNVRLYSLQQMDGLDEIDTLKKPFPLHVFGPDFDHINGRFMDTAAVIKNMDLVITIDTSVAHLAGALGVPTWILLAHTAEWQWLIDRTDSPWYPTARLFRQPERGDWNSVLTTVTKAVTAELNKKNRA